MDFAKFHLPTKPYSLIDLINRRALATGSIQNAMVGSNADYNGHYNTVSWNDYRSYYVGEYYWGERRVFTRTEDAVAAVRAGIQEFELQGRGATIVFAIRPQDADEVRAAFPNLIEGSIRAEPYEKPSWWTWKYDEVGNATALNQTHLLLRARDEDHYRRLQGYTPASGGGYRLDRELAAREWDAVRNLPLPGNEGVVP